MFNLEEAIKSWKRELAANQAMEDGYVAELEGHLRDHIEELTGQGLAAENAFQQAANAMGKTGQIGGEFYKTHTVRRSGRPPWQPPRFMPALFWNYVKVALRKIQKQKGFSFINIFGLAIGMASCILILLWVEDEFSFDRFHKNIDHLFQVATRHPLGTIDNKTFPLPGAPPAVAPALKSEYPEVVNAARLSLMNFDFPVRSGKIAFTEKIRMADASLFEMFSFPLIKGDYYSLQNDRSSIFITEAMAEKYFGKDDPLGKTLTIDNKYEFKVSGILKNIPTNSTLRFDFLVPLEFGEEFGRNYNLNSWNSCRFLTFVQLLPKTSFSDFSQKISGRINKADKHANKDLFLFPLSKRYLYSLNGRGERINTVRIFIVIALLILLIACINFMNLVTARAGTRVKEIGLRKVIGANRRDLIRQFLGESILFSFVALVLALGLVKIFLPSFSHFTGKTLTLHLVSNWIRLLQMAAIGLLTGILAGIYPALIFSAYQPLKMIKAMKLSGKGTAWFRNVLVVGQFSISIMLIIGTIMINRQHHLMRTMDVGLNYDQIVYINLSDSIREVADAFKTELKKYPHLRQVTRTSTHPSGRGNTMGNGWQWEGKNSTIDPWLSFLNVDNDFLNTFQIKMAAGTFFPKDIGADTYNVLINETFAKIMGNDWPVNKRLFVDEDGTKFEYLIIGVVKDFYFKSVDSPVNPMIISCNWQKYQKFKYLFIKLNTKNIPATLATIEKIFKKLAPHLPFEFHFLDEDYEDMYRNEKQLGEISLCFSLLAIFISCLGLFGLASFMAEQRIKEIGIRKVLGASVPGIFLLLSKKFTIWVLLASLIACPITYYLLNQWLQSYANRTEMSLGIFVFSCFLALAIALISVSYLSIKVARANPVDSLRYE